jgi:hypothetical protein
MSTAKKRVIAVMAMYSRNKHWQTVGLEVDPHHGTEFEVDEEKQDVVEPCVAASNHLEVGVRHRPDDRCADHEQGGELKAAHQEVPQPVELVLRVVHRTLCLVFEARRCQWHEVPVTDFFWADRGCLAGQTPWDGQQVVGQSAQPKHYRCTQGGGQNVPLRVVDDKDPRPRPSRVLDRPRRRRDSRADRHHVRHGVHGRSRRVLITFRIGPRPAGGGRKRKAGSPHKL